MLYSGCSSLYKVSHLHTGQEFQHLMLASTYSLFNCGSLDLELSGEQDESPVNHASRIKACGVVMVLPVRPRLSLMWGLCWWTRGRSDNRPGWT